MNMSPSSERTRILLVEDEREIRQFIRTAIGDEHYAVIEAGTVKAALEIADCNKPALVILDLGLPGEDGIAFIRRFRMTSNSPILVLSARLAEHDKVNALDAGADDYLTKPFTLGELLARIRALLRRLQKAGADLCPTIDFADVCIDMMAKTVSRAGKPVHLTPIEFSLLTLLCSNAGKVLTHRFLLNEIWGGNSVENSHYLRIYVSHLRQKLEADPTQPRHFLTETGIGYRFLP